MTSEREPAGEQRARGNWGRWGPDDERGAANLLTPDYLRGALNRSYAGEVFDLGVTVGRGSPHAARHAPLHLMSVDGGDFAALNRLDGFGFADDYLVMPTHASTHVDALSHVLSGGAMYNGHPWSEVRSSGARRCAIDRVGTLVARAHVLDVAALHGVAQLAPGYAIAPDELDAAAAAAGAEIAPGDALLVRTGFIGELLRNPGHSGAEPGLSPDCAEWIGARDVCLVGADNSAVEVHAEQPVGGPLHEAVVAGLGVYFVEQLDLERVAAAGVRDGLLVVAPLKIERGVGSPVNPVLLT